MKSRRRNLQSTLDGLPTRYKPFSAMAIQRQRVCMKDFSEVRALGGDKAHGFGQIVFSHYSLEVRGGFMLGFGLMAEPLHEQAIIGRAAEHAHDPETIGA